jgi:hypothetical protein
MPQNKAGSVRKRAISAFLGPYCVEVHKSFCRCGHRRQAFGVIEDGKLLVSETGTGQGQPISPLLANGDRLLRGSR